MLQIIADEEGKTPFCRLALRRFMCGTLASCGKAWYVNMHSRHTRGRHNRTLIRKEKDVDEREKQCFPE